MTLNFRHNKDGNSFFPSPTSFAEIKWWCDHIVTSCDFRVNDITKEQKKKAIIQSAVATALQSIKHTTCYTIKITTEVRDAYITLVNAIPSAPVIPGG